MSLRRPDSGIPFEVVRSSTVPASSPSLDRWHTTRHATPLHGPIQDRAGAPWQARFDWILDAPVTHPRESNEIVLTQRCDRPETIFCKAGRLRIFHDYVLSRLEAPVTLYVGNADVPLSLEAGDASRLVPDPRIRAFFCENKDVDVADVHAMPIGLHPTHLLTGDGIRRLRELGDRSGAARRASVYVIDPQQLPADDQRILRSGGAGCLETAAAETRHARWRLQSGCRFALVDWRQKTESLAVFETLALGSIPIVGEGPLSEAYDGVPVVRIRSLDEITPGNLDRWWRRLAPALADRRWLEPGFWWRRIVRTLPAAKRAFLVVGPESHGTHLVTDLLVHGGCHGHSGEHGPWHGDAKASARDRQPWDEKLPSGEDPIVWRRSMPHLRRWPDLGRMANDLEARGYRIHVVVVTRERFAATQSQLKWGHVANEAEAHRNIEQAFRHIFQHIEAADLRATVVSYESLLQGSAAQERLLHGLGLAPPEKPFDVWDGNRKWHELWDATGAKPSPDGPETPDDELYVGTEHPREFPFPEHWYPPVPQAWSRESKRVLEGRRIMADKRVLFCGLARDVAVHLPSVIRHIERAGAAFLDYRVVVFENDSEDDTVEALRSWTERNRRVTLLTDRLGWPKWCQDESSERMNAMAEARNRVLDAVAHLPDFDHVVVLDLDLPKGFSSDGLATTFADDGWDVVGSNSLWVPAVGPPPPHAKYFDTWAFRSRDDVAAPPATGEDSLAFERGRPWVPVVSCFGGLAVYSFEAFTCGARYAGPECEHVAFHRGLRSRGYGRQFLNPSQIVLHAGPEPGADGGEPI
ncbi:MAG: hypothetical protein MI919_07170 [Holophagales bacterium]|nr:hypothetical protein [Holophagales bacterium]